MYGKPGKVDKNGVYSVIIITNSFSNITYSI